MPYKRHQYKKKNTRYRTASRFIAERVVKSKKTNYEVNGAKQKN